MQLQRPHNFDTVLVAGVLISQLILGWLFFGRWRNRLTVLRSRLAGFALLAIWSISAYGLWLNFNGSRRYEQSGPSWLHSLASSVEYLWAFVTLIGLAVYFVYGRLARIAKAEQHESRRKLLQAAAVAAVAAPVAAITYGATLGRTHYRVRELDFPIRNLHPDLAGLRVAQVSDFHVSPFLSVREAGRVVDMTNELKPDLTFITGDLITEVGDPLDEAIEEIGRLKATSGVYGCLGNHEVYANCEGYVAAQAALRGVHFLRGEARQLRFGKGGLNIAGVDFQSTRHRGLYLSGAERLLVSGATNLLLSHNPDVFGKANAQGWDAQLSGHTHGGQVTFEILEQNLNLAKFVTPWVAGYYALNGSSCYVTRGIGTIGMPVRIGEAPEITLLRLVRA